MLNSSTCYTNASEITSSKTTEHVKLALALLTVASFGFFLYIVALMLSVFLSIPHIRENTRYVFFSHMLMNDTSYIALGITLMIMSIYCVPIPGPICFVLVTMGSVTFKTTSYNLAAMAIERYVAICLPLHHGHLCTVQRASWAIALMWLLALIPSAVDLSLVLSSSISLSSLKVICSHSNMVINPMQDTVRSIIRTIGYSSVGVIILCTYVRIILVAHKISVGSSLASQAGKTVMLHAFQLLLCMADFLTNLPVTNQNGQSLPLVHFLLYSCVPRFLSPLIYGLRDETLRSNVKQTVKRLFIWKGLYQR
ncbi:odorant receptor 131-2-like [Hyla sarda]|uniref:odorant receptor 131-2-like n=1 Tax=Hyla sarda TaxID=327740 RepID=UPI0024C21679|nr:odorant receptor 131-2-like [Hyla sarda]